VALNTTNQQTMQPSSKIKKTTNMLHGNNPLLRHFKENKKFLWFPFAWFYYNTRSIDNA